jgi:hypothetical protein
MATHIKDLIIENVGFVKSGRTCKLTYSKDGQDAKEFKFSTNTMYSPFGINSNQNKYNPNIDYSISCSINSSDTEFATITRDKFQDLDKKIEEIVMDKQQELSIKDEYIYNSFYKNSGNYPKLIKFNFQRDTHGNFKTLVFDSNKKKIALNESNIEELFKKGALFKVVAINKKIWYYADKVGTIWDLDQVLLVDKSDENDSKQDSEENEVSDPTNINECIMLD